MPKKDKDAEVEAQEQPVAPAAPRTQRLDVLARELGYTPQFIAGAAGRFRANGLAENPRYAGFAAARVRRRWDDDTQVTKEEIEAAIAEVASVTVR